MSRANRATPQTAPSSPLFDLWVPTKVKTRWYRINHDKRTNLPVRHYFWQEHDGYTNTLYPGVALAFVQDEWQFIHLRSGWQFLSLMTTPDLDEAKRLLEQTAARLPAGAFLERQEKLTEIALAHGFRHPSEVGAVPA